MLARARSGLESAGDQVELNLRANGEVNLIINYGGLPRHLEFSVALRPQRPCGLLGTGQDTQQGHLDFHAAS